MKTSLTLILLSVSTSTVFSMQTDTNDITFLQGAHNKHQCYNHCTRHNGKSTQWIDQCKADCDEEYDPSPPPPNQCYNLGDPCEKDSDCLTGGFNPCNKCGTKHGTQYYKRCYGEPAPTPAPTYEPVQCYNLGESCEQDSDCWQGGTNMCTRCGNTHGTRYYKQCYGEDNEQDNRMLDFIEESHNKRYGCMRNNDCGRGQECSDRNICVEKQRNYGCMQNKDCGRGQECNDRNICVEKQKRYGCMRNKDCERGEECWNNMCVDKQKNFGCSTNLDCGHHMKCKDNMCMPKAAERALRGSKTE